jgi:hydroxyethylthiazole kinase-like uncharacterized protein yjeF
VGHAVGEREWADEVLADLDRVHALVVGPGLGRDDATTAQVRELVARAGVPLVIDADGLFALGKRAADQLRARSTATILTPHDGEFTRLTGAAPGSDRLAGVRAAAARFGVTLLLKGSTTIVADPDGHALLVNSGGPFLATAGTGDVLSGVIGAFLAAGVEPVEAAAAAAHVHGRAGALGLRAGLVATDLPELVARWLSANLEGDE